MKNREHRRLLWLSAALFIVSAAVPFTRARASDSGREREIVFFFSSTCHECQLIKNEFLPGLLKGREADFVVEYRDISEIENYKQLFELSRSRQPQGKAPGEVKVPSVYFKGRLLVGGGEIRERLPCLLREKPAGPGPEKGKPLSAGEYTPLSHFKSFTPLAVAAAGLVDGINPCAFTVIVFFVSFLALQGFRRSHLALIGSFFIAGVFVTYLLIGLGLVGFFYKLRVFWWLRTALNWGIGLLSIVFGAAALIDAVKYARTGRTDGMLLSLPTAVKNRIHAVIGMQYRGAARSPKTIARLAVSAFTTGFLVSLLEAVCTGQMYLPTIVFVMKSTQFKLAALAYLVLYNIMFIVPLTVILALSVAGITSGQFSRFMERRFLVVKVLMAALFFGLGAFLLWRGI